MGVRLVAGDPLTLMSCSMIGFRVAESVRETRAGKPSIPGEFIEMSFVVGI